MTDRKTAEIHRMVMPTHTCPYGLKALYLLKRKGYAVDDHHLTTREQTDAFNRLRKKAPQWSPSICVRRRGTGLSLVSG